MHDVELFFQQHVFVSRENGTTSMIYRSELIWLRLQRLLIEQTVSQAQSQLAASRDKAPVGDPAQFPSAVDTRLHGWKMTGHSFEEHLTSIGRWCPDGPRLSAAYRDADGNLTPVDAQEPEKQQFVSVEELRTYLDKVWPARSRTVKIRRSFIKAPAAFGDRKEYQVFPIWLVE